MIKTNESEVPSASTTLARLELAESRARIYGILASVYVRPLDAQLLELLRIWGETDLPPGAVPRMMKRGLRTLRIWLKRRGSPPTEELFTALSAEFTRLFRGLNRFQSPPPPYESVYLDNGILYGASTLRIIEEYRQFRLKAKDNEPPDHIALELDFMRFLCEREAKAWENEEGVRNLLQYEYVFLTDNLAGWVPAFCENIRKFDATGFYDSLADVTEGWIYDDQTIIKGLIVLETE